MRDQRELMRKIERGERLVGEDPARLPRQDPRQQHPRALTARKAADRAAAQGFQIERGERGIHCRRPAIPPRQTAEPDDALHAHVPGDVGALRQIADRFCPRDGRERGERTVIERGRPARRLQQPGERQQQR